MRQSRDLRFAIQTAKSAGKILMKYYGKVDYKLKDGLSRSLLTKADTESEEFIISQIKKKFPEHAIFAEESGASGDSDFIWYIDPLDGTLNFAHGFPHFCVSIALAHDGKPVVGAVYDPYKDDLFFAEKGKGAFLENKKLRIKKKIFVSGVDKLKGAIIGYDIGGSDKNIAKIEGIMKIFILVSQATRSLNTTALDMCYVACGRIDAFFTAASHEWDVAAGGLILKEAGGTFTNADGSPWDLKRLGLRMASNGRIHRQILEAVKGKF